MDSAWVDVPQGGRLPDVRHTIRFSGHDLASIAETLHARYAHDGAPAETGTFTGSLYDGNRIRVFLETGTVLDGTLSEGDPDQLMELAVIGGPLNGRRLMLRLYSSYC
jgi:hypothetical protein